MQETISIRAENVLVYYISEGLFSSKIEIL